MNFKIHHIAYTVSNILNTIDFYTVFGFEVYRQYEADNIMIVHLKNTENFIIELFQYKNTQRNINNNHNTLEKHLMEVGIKHCAISVKNITEVFTNLMKLGLIPNNTTTISSGRMDIKYFFINDPDGNFVEIVEDKRIY